MSEQNNGQNREEQRANGVIVIHDEDAFFLRQHLLLYQQVRCRDYWITRSVDQSAGAPF